jgi:hypothetical protein
VAKAAIPICTVGQATDAGREYYLNLTEAQFSGPAQRYTAVEPLGRVKHSICLANLDAFRRRVARLPAVLAMLRAWNAHQGEVQV